MQMLLSATGLTAPTTETFRDYARGKFTKLDRLLQHFMNTRVRVSVSKERHLFILTVELVVTKRPVVVKVKDADLRRAIDMAYGVIRQALSTKTKKHR